MCSKWTQSFHYNKVGFRLELVINGVVMVFCQRGHKSFTRGVPKNKFFTEKEFCSFTV